MNDLTKAKLLLHNPRKTLKEIAEEANIPYQTLRMYNSGSLSFEKAEWQQINKLASMWDAEPTFNLLVEPWIKVFDNQDLKTKEVSLIEVLKNAKNYRQLVGDMQIQDLSILRLLLAILKTVYSRFHVDGKSYNWLTIKWDTLTVSKSDGVRANAEQLLDTWKELYNDKEFSKVLFDYLQKNKAKFDLFGQTPFYQANRSVYDSHVTKAKQVANGKGTVSVKQINRTISESNNQPALFSPRTGQHKNDTSLAELTRWLITYQNYTAVIDKTKVKSKNKFSVSAGWLYKLNPFFIEGKNLFETLMLNLDLVNYDLQYRVEIPTWEFNQDDYIDHRLSITQPSNTAEAYTLWSRMLHVELDEHSNPVIFTAGLPKMDNHNAFIEPMTIWKYNNKQQAFSPVNPSLSQGRLPAWTNLARYLKNNEVDKYHQPGITSWIKYLLSHNVKIAGSAITINAINLIHDGNMSSQLPAQEVTGKLIIKQNDINKKCIDRKCLAADITVKTADNYWRLINNIDEINGVKNTIKANRARDEFYFEINDEFEHWLSEDEPLINWLNYLQSINLKRTDRLKQLYGTNPRHNKDGKNVYMLINSFITNFNHRAKDALKHETN